MTFKQVTRISSMTKFMEDGMIIEGKLNADCMTCVFPNNMTIKGDLCMRNAVNKTIPNSTIIHGNIQVNHTSDFVMPKLVRIDGDIIASPRTIIACEEVQIKFIQRSINALRAFKEPTEKAKRLHEILWEL